MRVAIVGHGPSIKKAKLGDFIDNESDLVVRISGEYVAYEPVTHGTKTDYMCSSSRALRRLSLDLKPVNETWIYCPNKIYTSVESLKLPKECFNVIICTEEIQPWLIRYKKLNKKWKAVNLNKNSRSTYPYFSCGMASIIIASERIIGMRELLLVGFDNLVRGDREDFVSLTKKSDPATSGHNYSVEKQLLDEILYKTGVKLLVK